MGVKGIDWNSTALPLSKSLLIRDFFSKVLGLVRFSLHRLSPGVSFLFCSHSQVSSHSQGMGSSAHFWAQPSYLGHKSPELHSSPGDEAACHPICHPTVFLLILVEDHSNLSLKSEPTVLQHFEMKWSTSKHWRLLPANLVEHLLRAVGQQSVARLIRTSDLLWAGGRAKTASCPAESGHGSFQETGQSGSILQTETARSSRHHL